VKGKGEGKDRRSDFERIEKWPKIKKATGPLIAAMIRREGKRYQVTKTGKEYIQGMKTGRMKLRGQIKWKLQRSLGEPDARNKIRGKKNSDIGEKLGDTHIPQANPKTEEIVVERISNPQGHVF